MKCETKKNLQKTKKFSQIRKTITKLHKLKQIKTFKHKNTIKSSRRRIF